MLQAAHHLSCCMLHAACRWIVACHMPCCIPRAMLARKCHLPRCMSYAKATVYDRCTLHDRCALSA
jgi:hypothetical protein